MNEQQADLMLRVLADILDELQGLRSAFDEFRGYGTENMKDHADRLTGPTGYHLEDVHAKLGEVAHALAMIEINTSA